LAFDPIFVGDRPVYVLRLVFAPPHDASEGADDRQVVIGDPEGAPLVFGWRTGQDHWLALPGVARFRLRPDSRVVTAHPEQGAGPANVIDAYHGSVLPIAVQIVLGGQSLHASAVATHDGRIVAFCGDSHAGKTTMAVSLSRLGYPLWADDTVAFEAGPHGLTALRLPFEANLREQSAAYFDSVHEGAMVRTNGHLAEWVHAPLAGFCVIERLEELPETCLVERLSPREALIGLLAKSFRFKPQSPEEKRRMMQDYLEAVAQVPVFRLRYRAGFDALPTVIAGVEAMVLGGPARGRL
jgi:hypothetical protein